VLISDEMPASLEMAVEPTHPLPNGSAYDDFRRIDSARASQKKRRNEAQRNQELANQDQVYKLAAHPPVRGVENPGYEGESWEETLETLESDPSIQRDLMEVRRFIQAQEVLQAMNLAKTLRQENPQERSLDDPLKLTEALNQSNSLSALELSLLLSDASLREISGIDTSDSASMSNVEEEALKLAQNFTGNKVELTAVTIDKTNAFLGATVKNVDARVVISRIVAGGAVERDGRLQEGDEIVNINTQTIHGKTVDDVCEIMEEMTGHVTFVVISNGGPPERSVENEMFHVRTLFDYNPDADEYIPCKELGLFFKKGEILKIHRGDDENWWQAYKEGDNDMSNLARLVPSMDFEMRRRQLNKQLQEEIEKDNEPVLCGKKKKKKKKKNKKETPSDDLVMLPYEHVKLYQQPPDKKRPIVLIGPRNVGRYELRDRLTNEEPHLFCVPIAHTSRPMKESEVNGQDYNFVTKDTFEQLKKANAFVEEGEFQKNLYGTSIDSIRSVMTRGRVNICVMNAPSIAIMRKENLKPFVILIKPPGREQITNNLLREDLTLSDEEIEKMVSSGRIIEHDYGHLFDEIIINLSLDQTYRELRRIIARLETTPQWVPVSWISETANHY
jgi:guanylate kinase